MSSIPDKLKEAGYIVQQYQAACVSALFTNAYTKSLVPVEIQLKYNALARGNTTGNLFHFESVEFGDIDIQSVKIIY